MDPLLDGLRRSGGSTAGTNSNRKSLSDSSLTLLLAGDHAIIQAEVAADHVRGLSGLMACEVFAVVDVVG